MTNRRNLRICIGFIKQAPGLVWLTVSCFVERIGSQSHDGWCCQRTSSAAVAAVAAAVVVVAVALEGLEIF